ncbi:MAG: HD domain-containing protein [Planctomycetaceae bacterium]|nr:HD domain-containing protein [Planctomycetaceae bacterium]
MANEKLRRQIVFEAARLMYHRQEKEYYRAKMKAARKICQGWVKPSELPSNAEIRAEIQRFTSIYEADGHVEKLREMRIEALRFLRLLKGFKPRVIGSTLTGHIRKGSDIDIHVFAASTTSVTTSLDQEGLEYTVEQKQVRKHGEENTYVHIHVQERYPVELTVYPSDRAHYVFKSSITGKAMERASLAEFEQFLQSEYPNLELDEAVEEAEDRLDRFQVYASLLFPLGQVKQSRKYHPEGDALYHSLQVYDLMCDEVPYDEELLLAALLHDVGKGIDPLDHVQAGLEALSGFITPRTHWLIEHHMEAHKLAEGTIGARARRRLQESENYEDLLLLGECDRGGRERGVEVPEVEEALEYIRGLV